MYVVHNIKLLWVIMWFVFCVAFFLNGDWLMQRGQTPMFAREIIYTPYFYLFSVLAETGKNIAYNYTVTCILWNDLLYFLWCSLYCKLDTVKEVQGVELKLMSWLLQYLSFHALQCNPWPSVASLCVWYFCLHLFKQYEVHFVQQKLLPWNWKWQVSNSKI